MIDWNWFFLILHLIKMRLWLKFTIWGRVQKWSIMMNVEKKNTKEKNSNKAFFSKSWLLCRICEYLTIYNMVKKMLHVSVFRNYLTQKYTQKFGPAKIDICLKYDKNYIMLINNIVLMVLILLLITLSKYLLSKSSSDLNLIYFLRAG